LRRQLLLLLPLGRLPALASDESIENHWCQRIVMSDDVLYGVRVWKKLVITIVFRPIPLSQPHVLLEAHVFYRQRVDISVTFISFYQCFWKWPCDCTRTARCGPLIYFFSVETLMIFKTATSMIVEPHHKRKQHSSVVTKGSSELSHTCGCSFQLMEIPYDSRK
jgi:hypothetical protein